MSENGEYILGVNKSEFERLEFQHEVWKEVTDNFLNKINIKEGWKCLDVGSGPGFVTMQLLNYTGSSGEVTALEPGKDYLDHFKEECRIKNISNAVFIESSLENSDIEDNYFDLIYLRWVIDFVPEAKNFLLRLIRLLKKGGVIAIQDYAYEGLALFPKGGPFDNAAEYVKNYYAAGGGDPYFTVKVPMYFKENNVLLKEYSPVSLAGGNKSGIFQWAYWFFKIHLKTMSELNIVSQELAVEFQKDLDTHAEDPDMIFFSPVVVNIIGHKT